MSKKNKDKSSYPRDPHYAAPSAPPPPQGYGYGPAGQPYGPPPPYTPYATGVPGPAQPYPTSNPNMMVASPGYGGYHPQYPVQPQVQQPLGYPVGYRENQPVVARFDPGARFNAGSSYNVPPPPPGYAPTAAQMAVHSGAPGPQTVVLQEQKASWISGGTGGGTTLF